jgi:glycosyltransferase involved in cell wall biosynthesis
LVFVVLLKTYKTSVHMKILHVNMSLDPVTGGGTVERIHQLHESMRKMDGVSSRVLSLAVGESSALAESDEVILLPCWNQRWYLPAPKFLAMYRLVCQADVIHLMNHWTILNALIYWMARWADKPYIVCPAGALALFGRSQRGKRLYSRLVGRALVKNSAAAIAIAGDEVRLLKQYGVAEDRIQHIPNGVRLDDFSYIDEQLFRNHAGLGNARYLLFVGRLNAIKGPDLLLDAFIAVSSAFPGLHLVFIGPDGGMLDEMQSKAAKVGLGAQVHFAGYAGGELKSSAYHGASLLVVPSRQEAMSIVALEGAICGIPVVLTDRCGFDVLAEAGAARLSGASSLAISKVISDLMSDPDLCKEMGAKGQELAASSYTWDIAARRHVELFNQCVDGSES